MVNNSRFKEYRKKGTVLLRSYEVGEDLTGKSVSPNDTPKEGGMIARNISDENDEWYVNKEYFEQNYELAE